MQLERWEETKRQHFSENLKIRYMHANQPVFVSSSFIFPWPLSQIRRVPSSLLIPLQGSGSRSIQRRSITAFFRSSANFSEARALTEQHLPTLRKLKVVLLPEEHAVPPDVSSVFFLNHYYLQLCFWVIRAHYSTFAPIIQKPEMRIT